MNDPVLFEVDDRRVATVTLNRPDSFNGYNGEMLITLAEIFGRVDRDPDIRLMILRGEGKNFSAGADIKWLASRDITDRKTPSLIQVMTQLNNLSKPTLALVHGACVGGGVAWISASDVVIASDDAFFSIPEVRLGFVPGVLIPLFVQAMGERNFRRYGVSGEKFDAVAARDMGLVHEVCESGRLDQAAEPVIDNILKGGPKAISATKSLIRDVGGVSLSSDVVARLERAGAESQTSEEAAEGRQSFLEKRKPNWVQEI